MKTGGKQVSDSARAANFNRWFAGSVVVGDDGEPLVVFQGYDRAQTRPASFHGCAYWTEKAGEASAYAGTGHAFRRAVAAARAVERMIDPPATLPRRFDVFDSWPLASDYAGPPLRYFAVDGDLYWARLRGSRIIPRLVKGWRVKWNDAWRWGRAVKGQSEAEKEIRASARATAHTPGPVVQAAFLRILNPYRSDSIQYVNQFSARWGNESQAKAVAELKRLRALGHDGIIGPTDTMVFTDDDEGTQETGNVYITFSPTQAKSATGNRGTFSRRSGDVRNPTPGGADGR